MHTRRVLARTATAAFKGVPLLPSKARCLQPLGLDQYLRKLPAKGGILAAAGHSLHIGLVRRAAVPRVDVCAHTDTGMPMHHSKAQCRPLSS